MAAESADRRIRALGRHAGIAASPTAAAGAGVGGATTGHARRELADPPTAIAYESGFRYTVDAADTILTREERAAYEEKGFHVVRGLVPEPELRKYERQFEKLCSGEERRTGMMTLMRDVTSKGRPITSQADVNKVQNYEDDDVLFSYCKHPEILKYVEAFCGRDVMSVHTMLINKPPDSGARSSRHPLHQDLHYFPFRPADRICASWTAMERVTRANGCLVVVPGSHRDGYLLEHGYPQWDGAVNVAYHGIMEYNDKWETGREWLEMEAGDTVFFHPLLVHGSGANTTKGYRKAISCHYAASQCHYIEVKGTLQSSIADEVEDIAKKKVGASGRLGDITIDYRDIWRAKSRLVMGAPGEL